MSKDDLRAYFQWFTGTITERVSGLERAVRQMAAYASWSADRSPESLVDLGMWFLTQIELRPRTSTEMDGITSRLTFPIQVASETLTERTVSLAMDVGMYLGEVVRKNLAGTPWVQPLQNKKFADHGQVVIVGSGPVPLNPVRIVVTIAQKGATAPGDGTQLRKAYSTWAKMITASGKA